MLASAFISQIQQRFSRKKRSRVFGPLMSKEKKVSPIRVIRAIRGRTSSREFFTADYADNADIKEKNPSFIRLIRVISGQNSSPLRFSLPS